MDIRTNIEYNNLNCARLSVFICNVAPAPCTPPAFSCMDEVSPRAGEGKVLGVHCERYVAVPRLLRAQAESAGMREFLCGVRKGASVAALLA